MPQRILQLQLARESMSVLILTNVMKLVKFLEWLNLTVIQQSAVSDLPLVAQMFVEENQAHFIKAFFNIAGPLSLKQHAFELLPGIGKKKALTNG